MVRNTKQRTFISEIRKCRGDRGQSSVEYILMFSVVASIAFSILNSDMFKKTFGSESLIFKKFGQQLEYTYRHGVNGVVDTTPREPPFNLHDTYYKGGESRFYLSRSKYPE